MLTTEQIDEIRDSFAGLDAIPSRATVQRIATLASPMLAASAAPAEGRPNLCDRIVCEQNGVCVGDDVARGRKCKALATAATMSEAARDDSPKDMLERLDVEFKRMGPLEQQAFIERIERTLRKERASVQRTNRLSV
jgi:hypothetical protein